MNSKRLPLGKLPPELLAHVIANAPVHDERVLLGPGIGLDCAVIALGESLLVLKSDPITFATDEIGWYAVQINSNDIATAGATPRWFIATVLLPENATTEALVVKVSDQLFKACSARGISFLGGHTEITYGIDRPIIAGTLIGEVDRENLVTPRGATPGDKLLLTKGIPIEATAILAREFPERLLPELGEEGLQEAAGYLHQPGISVIDDARIACDAGNVTAMHDPTEGGLAAALWELAEASGHPLVVDSAKVHVSALSSQICEIFNLNPMNTIASGALLIAVQASDAAAVCRALTAADIPCTVIGDIEEGSVCVWDVANGERKRLLRPARDEITKVYE